MGANGGGRGTKERQGFPFYFRALTFWGIFWPNASIILLKDRIPNPAGTAIFQFPLSVD